ncbi:MAG: alpha/beta fold hydrolase [Burkholderiaceae bacterium]|nr:alpha/beta fold hydrolase [Microbacteriaceae bacterium]
MTATSVRRPRPVIRFLAALGTATLLLTGCMSAPQTTEVAPVGLETFYGQSADWQDCETGGLECATISAPIDYANPEAGSTDLAVIRAPSTGSARGSLLMNPGGPGGSGYDFVAQSLAYVADAALRENYDIVGWDPRGVGRSHPVTCYDAAGMDRYLYGVAANPVGSDAWLEERAADARAFAASCAENTGDLLGHVDAQSTARDMDLIRSVLGDDALNYLGFSYGTVFGTQYAELFPDRVGRVVLDGAVDPSLPQTTVFPTQMAGFDGAYRSFLHYCLGMTTCPFTGTVDEAVAQSSALFSSVDSRALSADDGRQLTSPTLGTALAYPLYDRGSWDALADMLAKLTAGDPNPAFGFADGYNGRNPDGSYSGNSTQLYTAALCLDGSYSSDLAGTRAGLTAITAAAPITGTYLAYSDWVLVDTACQNWPYGPVLTAAPADAPGTAPILVLGTTNDPATPYAWAQALASQLEAGVLVTRAGEGHTAYARGNTCIDTTVDDFLVDGTVPAADPMC